ncbi:MAG: hypothetical protein JXA89_24305 [Anaerolineae bacterium]|nr:hypothetical protein [Anaerolineae bacterium]
MTEPPIPDQSELNRDLPPQKSLSSKQEFHGIGTIPRSLAPFFQEYNLADLDPDQAAATIIERTLRYGNRAELRWLFHRYPESTVAGWVHRWGAFALPKSHLTFWRLLLDLEDAV